MKRYKFQIWFAHALIFVAALVLVVLLFVRFVPGVSSSVWILPALTILVSVCALVFAIFEAIVICRTWKLESSGTAEKQDAPSQPEQQETRRDPSPPDEH